MGFDFIKMILLFFKTYNLQLITYYSQILLAVSTILRMEVI
jgi:hypothetical protein